MAGNDKILTLHPQGKTGVNISRAKYDTIRDAIIAAVRERPELTFQELTAAVGVRLGDSFPGSIGWYVTTVKLDLEARGVVAVVGRGPQRLTLGDLARNV